MSRADADVIRPLIRARSRHRGGGIGDVGRLVVRSVEALPPEHRQMIHLAHYERLTVREIAGRTGLPVPTVHARITEALRMLSASLGLRDETTSTASATGARSLGRPSRRSTALP